MRGGHDSAAGVRIHHGPAVGEAWPSGEDAWAALAVRVGSAWVAATEYRRWRDDADFWGYSGLQKRTETAAPAAGPSCVFADEPPLSPEEEEEAYWAAVDAAPAQMELF